MEDAKDKAETLADAGGVSLGMPISISESGGPRSITFEGAAFAADSDSTPISVGELEVQINVQVLYGLE